MTATCPAHTALPTSAKCPLHADPDTAAKSPAHGVSDTAATCPAHTALPTSAKCPLHADTSGKSHPDAALPVLATCPPYADPDTSGKSHPDAALPVLATCPPYANPDTSGKSLADYGVPYPEPTQDQNRYVIFLDEQGDESSFKVQLLPGRMEKVDAINYYSITATVQKKDVEGWGFPYYVVTLGATSGTLMGAWGDAAVLRERFISSTNVELLDYNSKMPIVVYLPKGGVLHYRIWSASGDQEGTPAQKL